MQKFLQWLSSLVASAVVRGFESGVRQVFDDLDQQSPEAEIAKIDLGGIFGRPAIPLSQAIPVASIAVAEPELVAKPKRGRPKKDQPTEGAPESQPKKKRGRPRKQVPAS